MPKNELLNCLCPDCKTSLSRPFFCATCSRNFKAAESPIIDLTPKQSSASKDAIAAFWGDVCRQWYTEDDKTRTKADLLRQLDELEDIFKIRKHVAVTEMPLHNLRGKRVLEIGCGGGGHSALFCKYGAKVTAVDITPERVLSTQSKLKLLQDDIEGEGIALRADAENLPFADESFDIVYSSGVLHHTQDTTRSIEEVKRVLKPGGKAVLMLYSRHSFHYWLQLVPMGIKTRKIFKLPEAQWVGYITEGQPKFQKGRNPYTRVYSKSEALQLLGSFEQISLRKSSFRFEHLPVPKAAKIRDYVLRKFGVQDHPAGPILYGQAFVPDLPIETFLGKYLGWAWNITATKPL